MLMVPFLRKYLDPFGLVSFILMQTEWQKFFRLTFQLLYNLMLVLLITQSGN